MPKDKKAIPKNEKWIHNPKVMKSLKKGMKQANDGKVVKKDFSKFADEK